MARQFHRPARLDPEVAEQLEGSADTALSSEYAHASAQALIADAGAHLDPGASPERVAGVGAVAGLGEDPTSALTREAIVAVVAGHGVDAVAELWADSPATTLPGTLWRLFLVREWIRRDPALVERRYATTVDLSEADEVTRERFERALAGEVPGQSVRRVPAPEEIQAAIDDVLAGTRVGGIAGLAPLLNGVAHFLGALAAGSTPTWIDDDADELADLVTRRDSALLRTAEEFSEAAVRAQAGTLD